MGEEDSLEERVRKVQHLDPFQFSLRQDGRFICQLEKPVEELSPEQARAAIGVLEQLLERLREQAED